MYAMNDGHFMFELPSCLNRPMDQEEDEVGAQMVETTDRLLASRDKEILHMEHVGGNQPLY